VAYLFPSQGDWSEAEYFELPGNRLVEYDNGTIEVLPMPTHTHQAILLAYYESLRDFVKPRRLGTVLVAPMRVRVAKRKYREPDVLFMRAEHASRMHEDFWEGADLVMEVVSSDRKGRRRDVEHKPADYAHARIPEYWIVDPKQETITVLQLRGRTYAVHGVYRRGETAVSVLLDGFAVEVDAVLSVR
jgi:Uma2 family endonuclease